MKKLEWVKMKPHYIGLWLLGKIKIQKHPAYVNTNKYWELIVSFRTLKEAKHAAESIKQ